MHEVCSLGWSTSEAGLNMKLVSEDVRSKIPLAEARLLHIQVPHRHIVMMTDWTG